MPKILHILTKPNDALPLEIIEGQKSGGENAVELADLTAATPEYNQLLRKIFEADSVQVW